MISEISVPKRIVVIASCYAAMSLVCVLYYCSLAPSPDQSIYDYIAWQGLHGIQWYVGSFDVTWPGNLVIHEFGIRLFGVHRWTARLTDFLLLQPAILGIYLFLSSADLRWSAIAILFFYPIVYVTSGGWMAGHRDIVAMHLLVLSSATFIIAAGSNELLKLFLSGMLVGYAVMIRPPYLIFELGLLAAWLVETNSASPKQIFQAASVLGIGTLVFPGVFFIAGLASGTFDSWFETVRFLLIVYPSKVSRIHMLPRVFEVISEYMLWLALAGVGGLAFWFLNRRYRSHTILLLGMALTAVISFVAQNKGYGYHLGGLIPVSALAAVGGVQLGFCSVQRWNRIVQQIGSIGISFVLLLLLVIGEERRAQHYLLPFLEDRSDTSAISVTSGGKQKEPIRAEAISIVRSESCPQDRFFQWGWNFDVGFRSERKSGSRFVATPIFSAISRGDLQYQSWLQEFDHEIAASRPAFILLDLTVLPPGTKADSLPIILPDGAPPGLEILVSHLNKDYSSRRRWEDRVLFERKDMKLVGSVDPTMVDRSSGCVLE